MGLLEDYNIVGNAEIRARVTAAMFGQAAAILQTLDPTYPEHQTKMRFVKFCLSATVDQIRFVVSHLVKSSGLSLTSTDQEIVAMVTSSFDDLAKLYDANLEGA